MDRRQGLWKCQVREILENMVKVDKVAYGSWKFIGIVDDPRTRDSKTWFLGSNITDRLYEPWFCLRTKKGARRTAPILEKSKLAKEISTMGSYDSWKEYDL